LAIDKLQEMQSKDGAEKGGTRIPNLVTCVPVVRTRGT